MKDQSSVVSFQLSATGYGGDELKTDDRAPGIVNAFKPESRLPFARATCWLGREDSNLHMPAPKAGALPVWRRPNVFDTKRISHVQRSSALSCAGAMTCS